MAKVYVVLRSCCYKYPHSNIDDVSKFVDMVFDTERKAVDYIRKEIVEWHGSLKNDHHSVGPITDTTRWSKSGAYAYFDGNDGSVMIHRHLYYEAHDVK